MLLHYYKPTKVWQKKRTKISQFIIDETVIRVGREVVVWLWVAIEPKTKSILDMPISLERSILVAEQFLQDLFKKYGKNPVSTDDGGIWYGIHKHVDF